jgi:hypothetical protein
MLFATSGHALWAAVMRRQLFDHIDSAGRHCILRELAICLVALVVPREKNWLRTQAEPYEAKCEPIVFSCGILGACRWISKAAIVVHAAVCGRYPHTPFISKYLSYLINFYINFDYSSY